MKTNYAVENESSIESALEVAAEPNQPRSWFKAMRNPDTLELICTSRCAFVLAYIIAWRARWRSGFNRHGLKQGEAWLGDHKNYGMTEGEYRGAKKLLAKHGFATFKLTGTGTVARLLDRRLFDTAEFRANGQTNGRLTDGERTANDKRTLIEGNTDKQKEVSESDFVLFRDGWCESYQKIKGRKYDFNDAKDGAAVKHLVALGVPVSELLSIARRAWNHPEWFNCSTAHSIAEFSSHYNGIRDELERPRNKAPRSSPNSSRPYAVHGNL